MLDNEFCPHCDADLGWVESCWASPNELDCHSCGSRHDKNFNETYPEGCLLHGKDCQSPWCSRCLKLGDCYCFDDADAVEKFIVLSEKKDRYSPHIVVGYEKVLFLEKKNLIKKTDGQIEWLSQKIFNIEDELSLKEKIGKEH
jgi:hypothetical protein